MNGKARKLALLLVLGGVAGALYLTYWKARMDEIEEICNIVVDQGENVFTFKPYGKVVTIAMQHIS